MSGEFSEFALAGGRGGRGLFYVYDDRRPPQGSENFV